MSTPAPVDKRLISVRLQVQDWQHIKVALLRAAHVTPEMMTTAFQVGSDRLRYLAALIQDAIA